MKKIALCLFAALSFNAYADMPKIDYDGVRLEACQVAQKVVSQSKELTKPISEKTLQKMTDKLIDFNYHTMGQYYSDIADMMVEKNIDILSSEQMSHVSEVKERISQEAMDGFAYFITNRNCKGV